NPSNKGAIAVSLQLGLSFVEHQMVLKLPEDGPMLESVYRQMLNHYEEYKELDSLFAKTEDTVNEKIKSCLNKVYQDYQENKKRGKEIDFFFKTQDWADYSLLQVACRKELEELLEMNHVHLVERYHIKGKISKLVNDDYLLSKKIMQIPLGSKPRLYGTLQKIKHTNLYLFQALFFDPNHLIYEEHEFSKLTNMTCLFSKVDCHNE
ncbi:34424_t:CDS:2, partial [Racocetra persica]